MGNSTATLRWNHLFSDKLFSNTSVIYSNYDYAFNFGVGAESLGLQSVIRDWNFKQDFSLFLNNNNTLKFGLNAIQHRIEPGNLIAGEATGLTASDVEPKNSIEGALYIQNAQKIGTRLQLNYGLRYSLFNYMGEGTAYSFDELGQLTGETLYEKGESIQYYGGFEPRVAANYSLNEQSAVKLGYNRNYQYLHLLSNATSSTPTDVWIPSTNNVKPQIADQISIGYFRNFDDNRYETSVELYYKDMQNTIDYRNGAEVFFNQTIEADLVYGKGKAYGAEFYVKKTSGKLTGWVSYTLSRTLRQFDEINGGEWFSARQDRIHDLAVVAMYELGPKLKLSANFVYNTGDAVTFPSGKYEVDGITVPYYTERNGYRMPDYHRLDLGLTWIRKKTEKFESSWNFSLYNAYGRENAYSISFQPSETNPGSTEALRLALFKMVPSFSYNFKF
ncbi:MAG: TonB-dependent receptor [Bacteroidia bacterium]